MDDQAKNAVRFIIQNASHLTYEEARAVNSASGRTKKCWVCDGQGLTDAGICQFCEGKKKISAVFVEVDVEHLAELLRKRIG